MNVPIVEPLQKPKLGSRRTTSMPPCAAMRKLLLAFAIAGTLMVTAAYMPPATSPQKPGPGGQTPASVQRPPESMSESKAAHLAPSGVRLSRLRGTEARSTNGNSLGKVEDILLDVKTGKVTYLVLQRGGFLGIAAKHVPVPWKLVASASMDQLRLDAEESQLASAPTVSTSLAEMNDGTHRDLVDRFFSSDTAIGGSQLDEDADGEVSPR